MQKKKWQQKLMWASVYFKLDTSNLETWDATPIEDEQLDLLYRRNEHHDSSGEAGAHPTWI